MSFCRLSRDTRSLNAWFVKFHRSVVKSLQRIGLFHAESFTVPAVQTAPGRDALLNSILVKLSLSAYLDTNWVPREQGEFAHKSLALIVKQTCCSPQSKLCFGLGKLSTHGYVSGYSLTEYQHLPFSSLLCLFGLFCWDFLWPRATAGKRKPHYKPSAEWWNTKMCATWAEYWTGARHSGG